MTATARPAGQTYDVLVAVGKADVVDRYERERLVVFISYYRFLFVASNRAEARRRAMDEARHYGIRALGVRRLRCVGGPDGPVMWCAGASHRMRLADPLRRVVDPSRGRLGRAMDHVIVGLQHAWRERPSFTRWYTLTTGRRPAWSR